MDRKGLPHITFFCQNKEKNHIIRSLGNYKIVMELLPDVVEAFLPLLQTGKVINKQSGPKNNSSYVGCNLLPHLW